MFTQGQIAYVSDFQSQCIVLYSLRFLPVANVNYISYSSLYYPLNKTYENTITIWKGP